MADPRSNILFGHHLIPLSLLFFLVRVSGSRSPLLSFPRTFLRSIPPFQKVSGLVELSDRRCCYHRDSPLHAFAFRRTHFRSYIPVRSRPRPYFCPGFFFPYLSFEGRLLAALIETENDAHVFFPAPPTPTPPAAFHSCPFL